MANKVIDPAPIIKQLADRCLKAKGLECSVLGELIDMLRAAPGVYNAPYWATEAAYKNGYEAGKKDAVELPCKMGDIVWGIKKFHHGQAVKQGTVYQMFFIDDMRLCICVKNVCRGEWGKNVFATKEAAEAAIAERRTDQL